MGAVTREQKIVKARELRGQGLTYREIAERLGLSGPTRAYYWVHPERLQEQNARRGPYKRRHERQQAGDCPRCGQGMADPRAGTCRECATEEAERQGRERTIRFIELREQGLNNKEIEATEGTAYNAVAIAFSRAYRYGLTVPPSPYWERKKVPA